MLYLINKRLIAVVLVERSCAKWNAEVVLHLLLQGRVMQNIMSLFDYGVSLLFFHQVRKWRGRSAPPWQTRDRRQFSKQARRKCPYRSRHVSAVRNCQNPNLPTRYQFGHCRRTWSNSPYHGRSVRVRREKEATLKYTLEKGGKVVSKLS